MDNAISTLTDVIMKEAPGQKVRGRLYHALQVCRARVYGVEILQRVVLCRVTAFSAVLNQASGTSCTEVFWSAGYCSEGVFRLCGMLMTGFSGYCCWMTACRKWILQVMLQPVRCDLVLQQCESSCNLLIAVTHA